MRVIGGRSRGRRLSGRLPAGVRPTSDRVREAIFDVLGSMGGVHDLCVVDLFCGSGAMGVEALSRGAASATFVDHDPAALEAVRANLTAVGLEGESATVLRAELPGWLERSAPFNLAFCDPPYAFDDWDTLLGWLQADVAILESAAEIAVPEGWEVRRSRRYGGTLVTVVRQAQSPSVIGS
ncbi:MAG TPA: 16S rRNA (guanine(966)-N(2))-methyltransferase RsmD [Acidimicrobiales bacterium]|nr:16S rRNA (guanine(966)-N(2))-methyltransferase RsmD [Acidimicrobiales bacterium]